MRHVDMCNSHQPAHNAKAVLKQRVNVTTNKRGRKDSSRQNGTSLRRANEPYTTHRPFSTQKRDTLIQTADSLVSSTHYPAQFPLFPFPPSPSSALQWWSYPPSKFPLGDS